ncbi:MAG: ABC transporter ATP-binding protein [Ferruginibacter sp.]
MSVVIKVENLSKQYRLGNVGTGSMAHDVNRAWHRMRGREDPYLKIGDNNDRTIKGESNYVWALKDINFEVNHGEVLGIIGRNGAGKSTLLKILSRTTSPTTGSVKIKGRVASLLEVGTGFHPELSGRENIFLNGAILGMTRHEIKRKFDEIVDFAGVERYIDTPVKRYSSGMYVRLAFGVAAHLEPEILIVDEVLAVGDAEFQKKALGKMKDVSTKEGRTVLFVSHNMAAIKALCNKALVIDNGKVIAFTDSAEGMKIYFQSSRVKNQSVLEKSIDKNVDEFILWKTIEIRQNEVILSEIQNNLPFSILITYELKTDINGFRLFIDISDCQSLSICKTFFDEENDTGSYFKKGIYTSVLNFPENLFIEGEYIITVFAGMHGLKIFHPVNGIPVNLEVLEMGTIKRRRFENSFKGLVTLPVKWITTRTNES